MTGEVKPQVGVALLASLANAPVLPAYVGGTGGIRRLARIEVAFGQPVRLPTGQKATREDLAKWTDEIMKSIGALGESLSGH